MTPDEVHITSFVVCAKPDRAATVAGQLSQLPGHEVHAVADGKIVLTIELASEAGIVDAFNNLQQWDGVLAANLVYHHAEPAAELGDSQ